jgi:transcriptional regulator with XRE-family HTH domain
MTHLQRLLIQNIRFLRTEKKMSQTKLSELVNVSPNYLNAVENGKNFPSPEVLQRIIDALGVLPYQLFLEQPGDLRIKVIDEESVLFQELTYLKQKFSHEFDKTIQKYKHHKRG